ncbi:transmembrane protein, putative [Rhizoctonia solani AG-3 Rhs1AP]|uniref:Transmembrane protein, putative n=1 Tax=Rhizoctonia solani AG-3 Rhs1AP TaxID=1086054 RepID=A0A0A1ULX9_9AGAM|nr:transmembrane protein, putative [Rhizoctonia solani AG-3 Rhs1AP]
MSNPHTQPPDRRSTAPGAMMSGNQFKTHNTSDNGRASTAFANGVKDSKEEFDEYGAELEPEARVWKTYVTVADKFDKEQVEGWNSSLDVTLIFAGIFTAICTAFVIESAKSLKEDPAETSARRLDQITSILLVVANVSKPESLNSTELAAPISPDPFSPRLVDVCINALWFFSLSLSAAVSLLAMLAKEWCYLFMSGRIGDPWSQTIKRQRRLKGIKKWKMEELIMFLPSFIHLSVLSFAIGLCIYLGDLNWRVAILAVIVTFGSVVVYAASTFLPLLKQHDRPDILYPYSTSISKLIDRLWGKDDSLEQVSEQTKQDWRTEHVAVEALAWLIKTREDSESTNTALQAIAGADPDDANRELLAKTGADRMVSWRLIGLDSYSKSYERTSDLYTRALSFFSPPSVKDSTSGHQKNLNRDLQKKIRNLRDTINRQIVTYTSSDQFLPTPDHIQALSIGSTAASHCLRSLAQGKRTQTQQQFDAAMDLLERFKNRQIHLHNKEIEYLMRGIAMLLSSLLVDCAPTDGAQYVMKLIRKADTARSDQEQLCLGYLGLPMVVYALSRCDYPVCPGPDAISYQLRSREERAIDVVAYYVSHPSPAELDQASSTMINLGLMELLSDPESYKLNSEDFKTISEAFDPGAREARIYTLPAIPDTGIYSRSLKGIIKLISDEQHNLLDEDTKEVAIACLTVLNRTQLNHWPADASLGQLYAFVIECVLKIPPSGPEAYGQNAALDLMQQFHKRNDPEQAQNLMPDLAQWLNKREIFTKLKEAAEIRATSDDVNDVTKLFAAGQAWFLIGLAIKSKATDREDWRKSLSSFVGDDSSSDFGELAVHGDSLAERYRNVWGKSIGLRHPYLRDLYRLLPPSNSSSTLPSLSSAS